MSAYDLLDIEMLKEIDPDSVVEVQLPGERSVTQRRSITFHEDIDSPASFDDDEEINANGDDATKAATAKRMASTTANNDSFNDSFVLSWDMSPSKLHDATKISKIDSELLEQKMNLWLSSVSTSKECGRASIA